MTRFVTAGLLASVAVVLCSIPGRAQPSAADQARATQLFEDAQKQMAAGDYAAACPKFKESQRLDAELGTMLHLADCYEKAGKTASAWAMFKDAVQIAQQRNDPREKAAQAHVTALEPKLSWLTVRVKDPSIRGLEVQLDGEAIGRAAWGLEQPMDPGSHTVAASAPGRRSWNTTVEVGANAGKLGIVVPELQKAPEEKPSPTAAPATTAPLTPRHEHGGSGTLQTVGLVVGGAGLVGLATGGVLGLMAKSKFDSASSHCNNGVCDAAGVAIRHDAVSRGNVATVVVGVGAAILVAGGVIWLAGPHAKTEVGVGPGSVSMRGRF